MSGGACGWLITCEPQVSRAGPVSASPMGEAREAGMTAGAGVNIGSLGL